MGFLKALGVKKVFNKAASFATHAAADTKSIFDHVNKNATNLFDHGKVGKYHLFGAGSLGSQALADVSKASNAVGSALGSAGTHLSNFANSGVIGEALGVTPVGSVLQKGLNGVAMGLTGGRNLAKGLSTITKQKNYTPEATKQMGQNIRALMPNT